MEILLGSENLIYAKGREPLYFFTELCQTKTEQTPGFDYMVGVKELQRRKYDPAYRLEKNALVQKWASSGMKSIINIFDLICNIDN